MTSKRGHAINADIFTLRHDSLDLDVPFTTFADVSFRGVVHQAFCAADRHAFSYANATGEFTVGGFSGHILEQLDTVETQARHRYQAVVTTPTGVLSIHSYESVDHVLELVGALRPASTRLGVTLDPNAEVEYTGAPRVALTTELGVIELTPLTAEVIDLLPTWSGTSVPGGDLYAGRFTDDAIYATLVTATCRVLILPGADADPDHVAAMASGLHADWQA